MFEYGIIFLICLNVINEAINNLFDRYFGRENPERNHLIINGKQLEYNNSQIMVKSGLPLVELNGNYYFFGTDVEVNFFKAMQICKDFGMELLSIETPEENTAIDNYLLNELPSFKGLWTSGSDLGEEGRYVWLATGKPFVFTDWREKQPDNGNNDEDCIQLAEDQHNLHGRWNDLPCTHSLNYICEVKCGDFWKN